MVSSRASEVAELLWELKKAQKVATYTTLAKQAGFRRNERPHDGDDHPHDSSGLAAPGMVAGR